MTDHATKPSERILARARIIACYPATLNETPPDKYTLRALLEYIDEQAASANPSGEVAAPSPVEPRALGPEDFADSDCEACEGSGRIDTSGGANDMYRGWRWCDCAVENRNARRAEQAPQAEATPPDECVHGVHLSEDCPACCGPKLTECPNCGKLFEPNDGIGGDRCCDTGVIRAAEGVTLEPGEYEVVEVNDTDPRLKVGDRARPEKCQAVQQLAKHYSGGYAWLFLDGGPSTWVTAVRRVPLTEPEPVPEGKERSDVSLRNEQPILSRASDPAGEAEQDGHVGTNCADCGRFNRGQDLEKLRSALAATEAKLAEETHARELAVDVMHGANAELVAVRDELKTAKHDANMLRADLGELGLDENESGSCDTPEGAAAEARFKAKLEKLTTKHIGLMAKSGGDEAELMNTKVELARVRGELGKLRAENPTPPTAIPRGTTLEVGRWYRITAIDDAYPLHAVGDVVQAAIVTFNAGQIRCKPDYDDKWYARGENGGTYVTGLDLVPGPVKGDDALSVLRIAGYHDDERSFARVYVENRISYKVASREWNRGVALKRSGVRCTCFECKENHHEK